MLALEGIKVLDFCRNAPGMFATMILADLEVWPESHWPGFALREADVFKTYMAWWCM